MDANSIDRRLQRQLQEVGLRYRRLRAATGLAVLWIVFATVGAILLSLNRTVGFYVKGEIEAFVALGAIATLLVCFLAWRAARDPRWVARRIEQKYPQLEARLLTAIEQRPADGQYEFLQHQVIQEALFHGYRNDWRKTLPNGTYAFAHLACLAACIVYVLAILGLYRFIEPQPFSLAPLLGFARTAEQPLPTELVAVDPGHTSVERGTSLLVLARFKGSLPLECTLEAGDPTWTNVRQIPMVQSLDDPVFGGRIPAIDTDLAYRVLFGDQQSDEYRVTVFEYPALVTADAVLDFPDYTALERKTVQDVRHVTAVEGTDLTLLCHLNKPLVKGVLRGEDGSSVEMTQDADQATRTASFKLTESMRLTLHLEDKEGRTNKQPPEFVITVTPNRSANLELAFPSRDVEVSPIEELQLSARLWDDYGLHRYGVSYQFGGGDIDEITLGSSATTKEKLVADYLLEFEKLNAVPNQLLSYHFWAEDIAASGRPRRTMSDIFFAEVRPFDEIYRQGQQPPGGQDQQQQQQQGQNPQEGQGNQTQKLAQQQKEIITATWNVLRREGGEELSDAFSEDVAVIRDAQSSMREQVSELAQEINDAEAQRHIETLTTYLKRAVAELTRATNEEQLSPLTEALKAEQSVYQSLLNLRAREHEVIRANMRNAQQARNAGAQAGNSRSQQQLQQLALSNNQNRYETERQAAQQQQRNAAQEESRAILNRLRELARRQNDLNKRLQELQSELEQATDEQEREELLRQLKRLREQQQEILRDTDELNSQMDQSNNLQDQADAQQRLQQARENVRRTSEALEEGRLSQAISSGTRAQRELDELRDEFRKQTSEQFAQEARELRRQANELADNQRELSQRLGEEPTQRPEQPQSLRDASPREDVLEQLDQQNQRLQNLLDRMQETVREAEEPQPLLAEQLYDSFREARRDRVQENLRETERSFQRGFVDDARQLESAAREGIERLRDSIEQAAESVLGNETDALRRARNELEQLARELDEEIQQADPQQRQRGGQQRRDEQQRDGDQQGEKSPQGQGRQPRGGQSPSGDRQQQEGQQQESGSQQRPDDQRQEGENQQGENQQTGRSGKQQQSSRRGGGGGSPQQQREQDDQPQNQTPGSERNQEDEQNRQAGDQQRGPGDGDRPGRQRRDPNSAPRLRGPEQVDPRDGARRNTDGMRAGRPGGGDEEMWRPLTGTDFRQWADRLRDVEEMIGDPDLRSDAARIRDRAKEIRSDLVRHSKEPNWDLVRMTVAEPLNELRDRIDEELQRRVSKKALVPIDRDPVPTPFQEQVRRYYERIGSGE